MLRPIILTAPHGGRQPLAGIPVRDIKDKPKTGNRYVTGSDRNSDLIAQGIAQEMILRRREKRTLE